MAAITENARLPVGLKNAFLFATFNALSFQMILSSPMILFAKSIGATATVLGIITGMMPLLVIFQIPAANHVARCGYKRFVLNGWRARVMFIFGMALVPLAAQFLNESAQLGLLLFLLFGFNLSRGISSCAWLPWITSLVPAAVRGRYLAQDAACVNVASFGAFVLAAVVLGPKPGSWQFAVVFAFSALMGLTSLSFLKRIPEAETPEENRVTTAPVPWKAIANYRPFRKLLEMNIGWSLAYGGMTTFTVAYLKTEVGMTERTILLLSSTTFLGGLSSLWLMGTRLDRLGSKPVLTLSLAMWMGIVLGWALLAGKTLAPDPALVLALQLFLGLGAALINLSNTRLAMAIVPVMGRNHFFALFSVVSNLSLGLAPILWGLLIDALHPLKGSWHGFEVNRFSIFFLLVIASFLGALFLCRRLEEPQAANMEALLREIFIQSPQRMWLRFWPRS